MSCCSIVSRSSIAVVVILLTASLAAAQGGSDQARPDQEQLVERFLDLATSELNLTVEQREQLGAILSEAAERRRELGRAQAQLGRDIRAALTDPSTAQAEFGRLTDRRFEVQRQAIALQEWERQRIQEVLTERQTLRFMLLQERLARRIEAMQREGQGGRRQDN